MSLSPAFLDEVRARTSLSTLVLRTTKIQRAGAEWKGCCPFHNEKTPSFWVNDDKAFYHCFGCGAHGDAIRWLTDQQGLPFMDAVKELAAAAGMEMPAQDPRQSERDAERGAMIEIMERASRFYAGRLSSTPVEAATYLVERGITPGIAQQFGIGWAPNVRKGDAIAIATEMADVAVDRLIGVGLVKPASEERPAYDFFRRRIMFPIHDARGRAIAFGGRVLGDGQPKYLNSPDTPIFDKGRTLFNLHRAAPAARRAQRLVVVEGYMDVIGLASVGIAEAVAPNGTALTEAQIDLLWRIAPEPTLCFDGDNAGRKAAFRAATRALPMLKPGHSLFFAYPPDGKDPDDVARDGGADAVNNMLAKRQSLIDVIWAFELSAEPHDTPERAAGLRSRLREHVRAIKHPDVRAAYGEDIAKRFARGSGSTAAMSQRRSAPARPAREWKPQPKPQTPQSKAVLGGSLAINLERAILAGLLCHPDVVREHVELVSRAHFRTDGALALREVLVSWALCGAPEGDIPGLADVEDVVRWAESGPLRLSFTQLSTTDDVVRWAESGPRRLSFTQLSTTDQASADLVKALQQLT